MHRRQTGDTAVSSALTHHATGGPDAASFINRKTCVHMQLGGKTAYFCAALVEGGGRHHHRMLRSH